MPLNNLDLTLPQPDYDGSPLILDFPHCIDNTMVSSFLSCPHAFLYEHLYHRRLSSIHLHAGSCFATALETMRRAFFSDGKSVDDAQLLGTIALIREWGDYAYDDSTPKTLENVIGAFEYYMKEFSPLTDPVSPLVTADGHAIEFSFALPFAPHGLPPLLHPQTGDPLLYAGRFDMLAEYNGALFIEDDKTCSQLGAKWAQQWRLRSQFTGYVWAALTYGYPVAGAITRGICFRKNGFDHAESINYRPQHLIDRWQLNLYNTVKRMISAFTSGTYGYSFSDSCNSYGGCQFMDACESPDPTPWINEFPYSHWSPLPLTVPDENATISELLSTKEPF